MILKEYCTEQPSSKLLDEWSDKNGVLTPAMVLTSSVASATVAKKFWFRNLV